MSTGGLWPRVRRLPRACMRSRAVGHSPDPGKADIGGTIELSFARGENRPPLVAHGHSTSRPEPGPWPSSISTSPAAAVFIVDPAADLGTQIEHFAARFGLTPAETRVLAEIIAGKGLPAAAARLKITKETAHV